MTAARRLAAVLAGVGLSLAFAPVSSWGMGVLSVTALTLLLRSARSLRAAYLEALLFGIGFFVPLLSWVRAPGVDAWLALAVYQAALLAVIGPWTQRVAQSRFWPILVAMAWVGQEALRDRVLFGGFPWGRLAFAQANAPTLRWVSWLGAPGLSFVTALAATLLAAMLLALWRSFTAAPGARRYVQEQLSVAGALLAVVGLVLVSGRLIPLQSPQGPPLRVAVIQGNVPRLGLNAFQQVSAVLRNHVAATVSAAEYYRSARLPEPDIYIWPENSSDLDPFTDPDAAALIDAAVRVTGRPILVGAVLDGRTDAEGELLTVRNSGVVWNPDGTAGSIYVKRHPVPFGEYVPYRSVLGHVIGRLALIPHDFEKGKTVGTLPIGPTVLGDVICFEVAYDGIVRDAIDGGGKVLVVQTNNATFGRSSETRQQLEMSQIRAVEHNRAVIVSATSGISAVISPRGAIEQQTKIFEQQVLTASLPQLSSRTVADHVGEVPEWVLTAGAVAAFAALTWRRRRLTRG